MRWLCAIVFSLAISFTAYSQSPTVRIGVLGIFHPRELTLTTDRSDGVLISGGPQRLFLQSRSKCAEMQIQAADDALVIRCGTQETKANQVQATNRNQQSTTFSLSVPGKIKRRYEGMLEIRATNGELVSIVTMDLEIAVASVVQAESYDDTLPEALKAQAVVTRSYFSAGAGRHVDFDFCDLTHCQFLKQPPALDAPAQAATAATRGLVLAYNNKPIAALFTRSCAGHTRTPQEIGWPVSEYPYFSVDCDFCYKNPDRWTRKVSPADAALLVQRGEAGRLVIGRRRGWNSVPSNNFTATEEDGAVILHGVGLGHGVGLCQAGARNLAEHRTGFREILKHYFPNTKLHSLSPAP